MRALSFSNADTAQLPRLAFLSIPAPSHQNEIHIIGYSISAYILAGYRSVAISFDISLLINGHILPISEFAEFSRNREYFHYI